MSKEHKYLRKCPVCGKLFWCDNLDLLVYKHGYKNRKTGKISPSHTVLYCSYHCMRERDKQKEAATRKFNNVALEDRYGEV